MEENRKGPGIFYAVVGVATLVVAIIGATFAYFSATVENTGEEIEGTTADVQGALSLEVTRVKYEVDETVSDDLVPAEIDTANAAGVTKALAKQCVDGYYTGCHVYKIKAETSQNINVANIMVELEAEQDEGNWKYLVYTGTEDAATEITTNATEFTTTVTGNLNMPGTDIHNDELTEEDGAEYYLVVYLENINAPQNDAESEIPNATDETGTYTGTVTMYAAGGQVKATFTS